MKGDLWQCVKEGLLTASWNQWVRHHGGEDVAAVAGICVGSLRCSVRASSYFACPQNINEQIRKCNEMLENIRCWSFNLTARKI